MRIHLVTAAAIASALVLSACKGTSNGPPRPAPPPAGTVSVKEYGARGDGVTDDRVAIQAAIAAAAAGNGELHVPAGTYLVSQTPGSFWNLDVPGKVHIRGAGEGKTVLRQAGGAKPSVRLLHITGDDVLLEDLTLDGNKAAQTRHEQRHGIFAESTQRLMVRRVTSRDFTGDGFYLYRGANGSSFVDVVATANDRNGITLGSMVDGTSLLHSKFIANRVQQVDSEPGGTSVVSNTAVVGCLIDGAGVSNDYALTVSGTPKAKGTGWTIVDNEINGGVFVVWAEKVVIRDNRGTNPTTKPSVTVYRASSDVTVVANRFVQTQNRVRSLAGVLIQGTGTGDAPNRVLVAGNQIDLTYEKSFGVRAEGAIDVTILDNILRGPGRAAPGYSGIYLRATNQKEPFRRAVVRGNRVRNFGYRGLSVVGNGVARLWSVDIQRNHFEDDTPTPSMTTAISLDDGTGAACEIAVVDNELGRGLTADVINAPADATQVAATDPASGAPARSPEAGEVATSPRGTPGANVYLKRTGSAVRPGCAPN